MIEFVINFPDKKMISSSGTDESSTGSENEDERFYNTSIRQLTEKTNIKSDSSSTLTSKSL